MRMEDLILVSVDDHVVEPPDLFERHLPAKYARSGAAGRAQAGRQRRVGVRGPPASRTSGSTRSRAGRPRSTASSRRPTTRSARAATTSHERVDDMNAQRRARLDVLPVASRSSAARSVRARRRTRTSRSRVLRAYNDWHIDEWCGTYPGRFIPLAIPPIWDPAADGRRGAPRRAQGLPRGHASRRTRRSSACRVSSARTGTRSGAPARTRARIVCLHIGRRRRWSIPRPTRRWT